MEASNYWQKKYIASTVGAFPFLISLFVTCNQDFYLGFLLNGSNNGSQTQPFKN